MTPALVLKYLKKHIKKSWLITAGSVFFFGLLAHAFIFFNYLPNWDGINNLYSNQNTIHLGRCFLTIACGISSYYDLPWVNGFLSLVYLAVTAVILCELLEIRKDSTKILLGGLLAAFPAVTSTFAYLYTADGYFLAMLCMTLGIFLTLRCSKGIVPGILLICFAYGIYQAYITFAAMLVVVYSLEQLFYRETPVKKLALQWLRCMLAAVFGFILYYLLNSILLKLEDARLADYQGVSDLGHFKLSGIPDSVRKCLVDFAYFFTGSLSGMTLYSWLNLLMLLLLCIIGIFLIIRRKLWRSPVRLILIVLFVILIPFCCFAVYFISPNVSYHMLMHGGLYFVYVLFLVFYDRSENSSMHSAIGQWICLILSGLILYNFILIANICYQRQNISVQASMNVIDRMADDIFALPGLADADSIAVLGMLEDSDVNSVTLPPDMTGFTDGYIMTHSLHYSNLLADYYGLSLEPADTYEEAALAADPDVIAMPSWPGTGSIAVIDHTLVIKLSD